jgi:hemerythrin-like metal-binding protein
MPLIDWNEDYTVGVEFQDSDHQQLVQIINDLFTAMQEGNPDEIMDSLFLKLEDYAQYHFKREEDAMIESGYPDYEQHRQLHREIIKKLEGLKREIRKTPLRTSLQLLGYLRHWLLDHILVTDRALAEYLIARRR